MRTEDLITGNLILDKVISALSPVIFFINVPLALISGAWVLFTGGWRFIVAVICAAVFSPFFMGLLCAPLVIIAAFLDEIEKNRVRLKISLFCAACFYWLALSIWSYLVLTRGVRWGSRLNLNPIPVIILCLATVMTPFSIKLSKSSSPTEIVTCIIMTTFSFLTSIISIFVALYVDKLYKPIAFTFTIVGVPAVFIFYKVFLGAFCVNHLPDSQGDPKNKFNFSTPEQPTPQSRMPSEDSESSQDWEHGRAILPPWEQ